MLVKNANLLKVGELHLVPYKHRIAVPQVPVAFPLLSTNAWPKAGGFTILLDACCSSMSSRPAGVCGRELEARPLACTVEARLAVDLADFGLLILRSMELRSV